MTQADILSLLLFGKTTGALGGTERAGLQQQAAKMMAGAAAAKVGQAIAESLGLESLGVQLSDISTAGGALGFGRYLGENTYVSASQEVGGAQGHKVSVQYFITHWLSVTTTSASDGSHEIDLKLTKQF
jgi:autotransporter translocation and assembly factor TamB